MLNNLNKLQEKQNPVREEMKQESDVRMVINKQIKCVVMIYQ